MRLHLRRLAGMGDSRMRNLAKVITVFSVLGLLLIYNFTSFLEDSDDISGHEQDKNIRILSPSHGLIIDAEDTVGDEYYSFYGSLPEGVRILNETLLIHNESAIHSRNSKTCAIVWDGRIWCWEFEKDNITLEHLDVRLSSPVEGGFVSISLGFEHACALFSKEMPDRSNSVICWGSNSYGQIGDENAIYSNYKMIESDLKWEKISSGGFHNCGVSNGSAYCWGNGELGQIGVFGASSSIPKKINFAEGDYIIDIGSGSFHSCGLTVRNAVYCWGWNGLGQLGSGNYQNSNIPIKVQLPDLGRINNLNVGDTHNCVEFYTGEIFCWGDNGYGQILDNNSTNYPLAIEILSDGESPRIVTIGGSDTCLESGIEIRCMGKSFVGFSIIREREIRSMTISEGVYCFIETTGGVSCSSADNGSDIDMPIELRNARLGVEMERGTIVGLPSEEGYFSSNLDIGNGNLRRINLNILVDFSLDSDQDTWSNSDELSGDSDLTDYYSIPDDFDGDRICDGIDSDIDGDGFSNEYDDFPYDPEEWSDRDNDGVGSNSEIIEFTLPLIGALITVSMLLLVLIYEYKSRFKEIGEDVAIRSWLPISQGIKLYNSLPLSIQSLIGYSVSWIPLRMRGHKAVFDMVEKINVNRRFAEIENRQLSSLKKILDHAHENVPFYQKIFSEIDIDLNDFNSLADLNMLPIIEKGQLRTEPDDFRAENFAIYSPGVVKTSGSTGEPLEFLIDQNTRIAEYATEWKCLVDNGARLGGKTVTFRGNHYRAHRKNGAHWHINALSGDLHFNTFAMDDENCKKYVEKVRKFNPEIYRGYPSSLAQLASGVSDGKLSPEAIAFCSSEMLSEELFETIYQKICGRVVNWYSQSEYVVSAGSCAHGNMHINSEFGILEVVDDEGNALPDGEVGRLIGTSLTNYSQPFIRYDLEDIGSVKKIDCKCGNKNPVLHAISGRMADVVKTPDGRKLSTVQMQHWWKHQAVIEWDIDVFRWVQIVQKQKKQINFRFVPNQDWKPNHVFERVQEALEDLWGSSLDIEFERLDEIPHGEKWRFSTSEI